MAPFANREIVAAKTAFAIMTAQAALTASGRVMIERLRLCHLPALLHAGPDLMARIA